MRNLNDIQAANADDDLLRYVASRQWDIVTVSLPSTPLTPFDVVHKLKGVQPAEVRWEVIQKTAPCDVYQFPSDAQTTNVLKLRADAVGGEIRILLWVDDGDVTPLNLTTDFGRAFPGAIYERGRATPLGQYKPYPFATANFLASGSMTWTVVSPNVQLNRYRLIGDELTWKFGVGATTVGGTPSTDLLILLPENLVAANSSVCGPVRVSDAGSPGEWGIAVSTSGSPFLSIRNSPTAVAGNWSTGPGTLVQGTVTIEVSL